MASDSVTEVFNFIPLLYSCGHRWEAARPDATLADDGVLESTGEGITLHKNWVSPGYFQTAGIPVVSGREFDEHDREHSSQLAIVNESIARRYFPGQNPLGRRLRFSQLDTVVVTSVS